MRRGLQIAAIAASVGLVAGCAGPTGTEAALPGRLRRPTPTTTTPPTSVPAPTTVPRGPVPAVTVQTLKGQSDSPPYDATVQVPVLAGVAGAGAANQAMARAAGDVMNKFVDEVSAQGPPPAGVNPSDPSARSTLTCRSETRLTDARLASFRLTCAAYEAGAAHANQAVITFNVSLADGRLLVLDDLFAPTSNYLAFLSQSAISQLDARYNDDTDARQGAGPSAANFAAWSLTPTGLDVTFADGQVGPDAIGTPSISVPYAALAPYVRHPGPLDQI